jgi:methylated-DNA-protein-cysteine methyltransferase-like protein
MEYHKGRDPEKDDDPMTRQNLYTRFYEIIHRIPEGKVATYGQVATLAGYPGYARQVGYSLNSIPEDIDVPWHRVINSKGQISIRKGGGYDMIQRLMLEKEGVCFDHKDRVPLSKYQWVPDQLD